MGGRDREPDQSPAPAPDVSESVLRAVEAPYLSTQERSAMRVFHGLWTTSDVESVVLRARAALQVAAYDDASLRDPAADPADRAEAALARGEPRVTLGILQEVEGARAVRLRAEAYEALGMNEEAKAQVQPLIDALRRNAATSAEELVESVGAIALKARLEGKPARDYKNMLDLLIRAQQEIDRFYWPALVAQAELLYEKDNYPEAGKAAVEALSLNPASARAWRVLGRMGVDGFNFGNAERIAARLDELARRLTNDRLVTSPFGDMILARAWMRQNDATYALEKLQPTLDRYPTMLEAMSLHAACAALTFDYEMADELLESIEGLFPNSPVGPFEVGRALAEARQYAKASEYLERASVRAPNWAPPVIELGLMEMQSGRDVRALDALRRANQLDAYNTRARNSLRLVEELVTYETVESPNFIIRHRPGVDAVMAREMPGPLEEIHRIVAGAIDHAPAQKTVVELLPDHRSFAVRITGMTGIHTIAASTGPVLAMEAPKVGKLHSGEYDWVRVLRHEYTHTVTLSRTNNRIPHWFTEASAVFLENVPRDYETCQLLVAALTSQAGLALFDMSQINVAFVRPAKQTDRPQAYAQGHWMYAYIVERWGERAPLQLMDLYALGIREDQAMQSVLGVSQEVFLADFRLWARKDAATWGMLPERSLQDLLLEETLLDPVSRGAAEQSLRRFALGTAFHLAGVAGFTPYEIDVVEATPEVVERMLGRHPDHPDVLELMVQTELERAGGAPTTEMIPLLERYAAARPVDPMPHRHLAKLHLASESPERAIPHLEFLDAREQKSAAYAIELARRHGALGDWEKAWAFAERATQVAPFDPGHREIAASAAIKRGSLEDAERHITALTDLEPQHELHRERLRRVREMRAAGG